MRASRFALLALLAVVVAACSSSDVHQPSPLPASPGGIHVTEDWSLGVGGGGGNQLLGLAPDADDGLVLAASAGGHVVAVDAATGKMKWQRYLKAQLSGGPTAGGNYVAVGTRAGNVIALDAGDGHVLWKQYVGSPVIASPAVGDGVVIVNTLAGDFIALDAASGTEKWKQSNQAPSLSLRTTTRPLIANGVAFGGFADGKAMAVEISSGKELWLRQIASGQGGNLVADMVDVGRRMAYGGGDIYITTYQGKLAAVAAQAGQVIWDRNLSSYTGVSLDAAHLYASDADGQVHAYDLVTGVPQWTYSKLGYRNLSAPAPYGPLVAVGDRFGFVHFLNRDNGHYLGRIKVGGGAIRMAPIVVDGRLVVLDGDGTLAAYRVRPGGEGK